MAVNVSKGNKFSVLYNLATSKTATAEDKQAAADRMETLNTARSECVKLGREIDLFLNIMHGANVNEDGLGDEGKLLKLKLDKLNAAFLLNKKAV